MKPFISETETQLKAYNTETGDYKMLATNLNSTNENLVKSCTMTGTPVSYTHLDVYKRQEKQWVYGFIAPLRIYNRIGNCGDFLVCFPLSKNKLEIVNRF